MFPSVDIPGIDPTRLDDGMAMTWGAYRSLVPSDYDVLPDLTFFDLADGADPRAVIARFPDGVPDRTESTPTEWLVSLAPAEVRESDAATGLIWMVVGLLGALVVATIGHGMATTAQRRHGDYAVLRALGFTRRQVLAAVTSQSTTTVVLALFVGVPIGIVLGRWSWRLFARDMGVVEAPVVPVLAIVIAAGVALVAAAAITVGPATRAGRSSPAAVLRVE